MAIVEGLLLFMGMAVLVGTALPLLRVSAWWIRGFDFPRAQLLFLGGGVLAVYPFFGQPLGGFDSLFLLLLSAALGYQGWRIFAYTRLAVRQVQPAVRQRPETTVRLLVANVFMNNRNADHFLRLIEQEQPDILLVVEADRWWEERLRPLENEFPWQVRHPQDNTYGMLLYSRHEITARQIHFLVREDVPSFQVQIRLPSTDLIELWGVHPQPPAPQESRSSAPRDAELLLIGKAVEDLQRPVIVAGDLNDVAWSRTTSLFQKISGLLDPRVGRGRFSTYHARYPFLRWPLDHVFHSEHFHLVELRVLPGFGSDHFPILAVLSLETAKRQEQEVPEPQDSSERRETREKIREGVKAAQRP